MAWTTDNELVGKRVTCYVGLGEHFSGLVVAVHTTRDLIKVKDEETGELLFGNQWDED